MIKSTLDEGCDNFQGGKIFTGLQNSVGSQRSHSLLSALGFNTLNCAVGTPRPWSWTQNTQWCISNSSSRSAYRLLSKALPLCENHFLNTDQWPPWEVCKMRPRSVEQGLVLCSSMLNSLWSCDLLSLLSGRPAEWGKSRIICAEFDLVIRN